MLTLQPSVSMFCFAKGPALLEPACASISSCAVVAISHGRIRDTRLCERDRLNAAPSVLLTGPCNPPHAIHGPVSHSLHPSSPSAVHRSSRKYPKSHLLHNIYCFCASGPDSVDLSAQHGTWQIAIQQPLAHKRNEPRPRHP